MASGDVDSDGIEDLLVGYGSAGGGTISIHRGNLDAIAPQSEASFNVIAAGGRLSPFIEEAQVFEVPTKPDFVALGNFSDQGTQDLVVASRGANSFYVLEGDGKGNFSNPKVTHLPGAVTALAAGNLGREDGLTSLVIGVTSTNSSRPVLRSLMTERSQRSSVLVYKYTGQAVTNVSTHQVNAAVSSITLGDVYGALFPVAANLAAPV